jgi:hypothetical protein
MRLLRVVIVCFVAAFAGYAAVVHEVVSYKTPIQKISGRVVGFGAVNPGVLVQVRDKPHVWLDDSLSLDEKRKRQSIIASTDTDSSGNFTFHKIPKGSYEVEFSGRPGWNPLSALVVVDPAGSSARMCVVMSIEGGVTSPSVRPCRH